MRQTGLLGLLALFASAASAQDLGAFPIDSSYETDFGDNFGDDFGLTEIAMRMQTDKEEDCQGFFKYYDSEKRECMYRSYAEDMNF